MASYYEAMERALPRNCSSDWVAVTKYVDDILMGSDTTEQIRIKRALYVARMSGPDGNTTLVKPLSDSEVLNIPSDDIAAVLLDPRIGFQVSRVLPPSRGDTYHDLGLRATHYHAVLRPLGDPQFLPYLYTGRS